MITPPRIEGTVAVRGGRRLGFAEFGPVDGRPRDWGFELADIALPVVWWHGDADHIVPLAHGRHCVERLPDAELRIRPGESHLGGLAAAEEVLETLLERWDKRVGTV